MVKGWFDPFKENHLPGNINNKNEGDIIVLIKPQFEAGRKETAQNKGVIRDPEVHKAVLIDVLNFAQDQGLGVLGLMKSPLLGPKGNVEFLAWLGLGLKGFPDIQQWIQNMLE